MGRAPNHRFSVAKGREVTTLESKFDSVKRRFTHTFSGRRQSGEETVTGVSPEPSYRMPKKDKRGGPDIDWDEMAGGSSHESGPTSHSNTNGLRGGSGDGNGNGNGNPTENRNNSGEEGGMVEAQKGLDFGPYPEAIDRFLHQLTACQNAINQLKSPYTEHKRDIRDAMETRQKLEKVTERYENYRTALRSLKDLEKEKDEDLAKKLAEVEREKDEADEAKKRVEKLEKEMEEEKEKFEKSMRETKAEQKMMLDKQSAQLFQEQNEEFGKRVKSHEKKIKERQDGDEKRIAGLEAEKKKLLQELKEEKAKLGDAEVRCKDLERLKKSYGEDAEKLRDELKRVQNEFGLNTKTDEFYKSEFLNIYSGIEDISTRYMKELHVQDFKTIHEQLKMLDEGFASIPISSSPVSENLRVAHAQRVISSCLFEIIWKPFSSEITAQDSNYVFLLNQISEGLEKSAQGSSGGRRAARVCNALAMRGLQSQLPIDQSSSTSGSSSPPVLSRADKFTHEVMAVLSLVVKTSLHPNLRNNLLDLANSAISVWYAAQTDERKIVVHPTLDPAKVDEWRAPMFHKITTDEDMSPPNDGVITLFPRITAQNCSWIADSQPKGLPGLWIESEPQSQVTETCIYSGAGVGKWSELVREGEEEEEDRKDKEARKMVEEKKKMHEEEMKKLEESVMGHRRTRRESSTGSGAGSNSERHIAAWMKGGGQKILEGDD